MKTIQGWSLSIRVHDPHGLDAEIWEATTDDTDADLIPFDGFRAPGWSFHVVAITYGDPEPLRENHGLVTSGVYARIRHPMYASMFLLGIAQALFLPNWIVGPAYLLSFGVAYVFRVQVEERMMLDHFGSQYEAYMQRTGRLIPRIW